MSTMTLTRTESARSVDPAPRFTDLLAAEWIKLRSLRSTYWVLALASLVAIGINLNAVHSDLTYIDHPPRPIPGLPPYRYDALYHSLSSIACYVMAIAAGSLGAITVFGEYTSGMIRTTFAAVPDRRGVIAAKVLLIGGITALAGAVVSTVSFFACNAMLASRHVGLSIAQGVSLQAVIAYAAIVPVCALIGMALGALLRHATASIVSLVMLLFILPLMFGGDRYRWLHEIGAHLPMETVNRLTYNPDSLTTISKWAPSVLDSWITMGVWAVVSVAVTAIVVRRRDV
ncbi:ABC transporter permease subunit [Kitasatospora aureofaciens]|uniref:ABC transporter permease n=2 Tax=Kitasatospora aureofaciens TaxID=1894 RepID=A0A8H9HTH0_KITAU|nr:ABC transporter permease subunit [Kitasatospora aureofaciens]ARF78332.1 ABC transporter permease [Kitasatospora aureofaciens]GGU79908.1 ABC transporter permease [Kitasatospora aureofaciens]